MGWDSSVGIATRYRLYGPGIESQWGRGVVHPSRILYNGWLISFLRVKRLWSGIDHLPPSSTEVTERVELYLYSPSGLSWPVIEWTSPFTLPFNILIKSTRSMLVLLKFKELFPVTLSWCRSRGGSRFCGVWYNFWNPLSEKECKITNTKLGTKVNIYLRPLPGPWKGPWWVRSPEA